MNLPAQMLSSRMPVLSAARVALVAGLMATAATAAPPQILGKPWKVKAVHHPPARPVAAARGITPVPLALPFPQPPVIGFQPLMVLTTSDRKKNGELEWEHVLESSYVGSPLNPPASENYVVAVIDSGSTADILMECDAATLGLTPSRITPNTVTLSGAGGEIEAFITYPLGIFVAPFTAVDANVILDLNQVVGHSNIAAVQLPQDDCESSPLNALIGTEFLAFYNTSIRPDQPQVLTVGGRTYKSPLVQILPKNAPLPTYPRRIAMNFGGLAPATTASFFGDFEDFKTPITPTMLAFAASFPTGGAFFSTMGVLEGEPGPTNPIQNARVLVDTGAQATVISPGMAANLNLPAEPDFLVETAGVGGTELLPGYYVDYLRINALGGALEFSQVPVVVFDLPSIDGLPLDGIMGMNLFWNRNIIFEPSISGSGFLHVSDPIPFAYGDFDYDFDVDAEDFDYFQMCTSGPTIYQAAPECRHVDYDMDGDVDGDDFGVFQRCYTGPNVIASPTCSQ